MMTLEHTKYLAEIGARGGAAGALTDSCRKSGRKHKFDKDGRCTHCGAHKSKYLASMKNVKKSQGRPRQYKVCGKYGAHRFVNDRCPCGETRTSSKL
jgi:hypothetical protein